jgi:OmcA/MtrC family decaheme c-type cytochrome
VLRFNAKSNGATYDVLAHPFTTLAVTLAGPTSDYASAVKYPIQGLGALGTLTAVGADFVYTFPAPIPADATGTYAVGMEASLDVTLLPPRSYSPNNPIAYVAVTDPAPVPRRAVVERAKCNSCHVELAAHGGTAKSPDYCVLCHSPGKVNDQQVSRFQVPTTVASSMNFKVMVHKIHRGTKLTKQPYVLGGAPAPSPTTPSGNPIDFGKVRFPGNTVACWACHASTSYMLPLPKGQVPTRMTQVLSCNDGAPNPAAYCASRSAGPETFLSPAGAACAACHDSSGAEAHVRVMVGSDGTETCETCHGVGKQWDVQTVHVLPP